MRYDLLVTGFGPFEGIEVNPSEQLARTCGERFEIIEVSYDKARRFIDELDPSSFQILLMIGAHGFASQMFFETVAHNRFDDRADVSGHRPNKDEIRSGEPGSLKGSLWNQLDLIRHLEGPASLSEDAGGYLCNFIYYEALRRFPNHRVGFLHVPTFDKLSEDIQAATLKELIAEIRG